LEKGDGLRKIVFSIITVLITQHIATVRAEDETPFDGLYLGGGVGCSTSNSKAKIIPDGESASANTTRPSVILFFGNGRVSNSHRIYFSGEVSVDLALARHKNCSLGDQNMSIRNNGITPSLGFRIGRSSAKELHCMKVGIIHTKVVLINDKESLNVSKLAPIVAYSLERRLRKGYVRFDFTYRMKTKRKNRYYELENGHGFYACLCFSRRIKL
jgi:hypothetical protein